MALDVDGALGATQLPQGGVGRFVAQGQFAAGIEHPAHDHGQRIGHPGLRRARVEGAVQPELLGQRQQRGAGAVLLTGPQLQGFGRRFGHDLPPEGGLQEFKLLQGEAGEAAVVGVFDLAVLAVGGTDQAVGRGAVQLDLQVEAARLGAHRGYSVIAPSAARKGKSGICMATNETKIRSNRP